MKTFFELREKTLTKAELKKREEVAKAIERENPNMPMDKKMAIATATAKKVAEEVEQVDELNKSTLGSYVKKASGSAAGLAAIQTARAMSSKGKADPDDKRQFRNRLTGISRATDKLTKEEVEQVDEISRDTTRSYIRKAHREYSDLRAKDNKTPDQDKKFKKREAGIELAGKKTYNGFGTPRVQATESAELDEGIANLSNARLKYHVTKNFPHGSYTRAEIEDEHKRRLRVEPEYHKAKPSLSEAIDDVSTFSNRKLSSIANSLNHPDRVAAKNELNRRRMRNEEAELGEAKKPKPSNNALVFAKNLEKIKAAIKKEEVDQIDEISQKLKDKYVQRSMDSHTHMSAVARDSGTKESDRQHLRKKMKDRNQGMARAFGQTKDTW